MNFTLDPAYLTQVSVTERYSMYRGKESLTEEETIKVLKGLDIVSSHRTEDHPEFAKLRNQLEADGFIKTQRAWWNGDIVLKSFTLNDYEFKKNEQFPCGSAISLHMKFEKKYRRKI